MSIPKKGARKISVGNENYLWLIRKKATYMQSDYGIGRIHVAIEKAEEPGTTLLVHTDRKHSKDMYTREVVPVTPSDVSLWITQAIELGWLPGNQGTPFSVEIEDNKMNII